MIQKLFKTSDGEVFGNEEAAVNYEAILEKRKATTVITEEVFFGGFKTSGGYTCRLQRVKISSDRTIKCGTMVFTFYELEKLLEQKDITIGGLRVGGTESIRVGCTVGYWNQIEEIRDVFKRLNWNFK